MSDRVRQWGGIAAIAFVALILVGIISAGSPPAADDPADKIRAFFVDNRGALLLGNLLGILAIPFVLWFAAVLRDTLRGDDLDNALGTAGFAGLVASAAMALAGGAVAAAPVYVDGVANALNDDTLRLVYEAQNLLFAATAGGFILFSLTTALAIRRTQALPAYTMWLALLAAVGNLVAVASSAGATLSLLGFVGVLTFALFVLVTGIVIALGRTSRTAAAAA